MEFNPPKRVLIYYTFVLCFLCSTTFAQNREKAIVNQKIKAQATELVENNRPNFYQKANPDLDLAFQSFGGFLNAKNFTTEHYDNLLFSAQVALAKKDNSLNLYSSIHQNNFALSAEDNEDRSRFNLGLDVEILRDGFAERKKKVNKVKKDFEVERLRAPAEFKDKNYAYRYNCLIYAFNQEKLQLLENRISYLERYINMMYELYFAHELAYAKIIQQKGRLEETQILTEGILNYNTALEKELGIENIIPLNTQNLPMADIDIDQLLSEEDLNIFHEELKRVIGEQIELKYENSLRSRLKAYARYNYGDFGSLTDRPDFFSFGLRFNTPLSFSNKVREEAVEYEKILLDKNLENEKYNNTKELINYYSEYQYKLKQYNNFVHKLFTIQEELRVEKVLMENDRSVHSPMRSIKLIDNYRAVEYELIDLKQQMYLLVLKMHRKSFQEEFTRCMVPIDFQEKNKKLAGNRFYLLDPQFVDENGQDFLVKYLQKNEIKYVLLPANWLSTNALIEGFQEEGIEILAHENSVNSKLTDKNLPFVGTYIQSNKKDQTWVKLFDLKGQNTFNQFRLTTVPFYIFKNRNELEQWIKIENQSIGTVMFLFEDLNKLKQLDSEYLGMK